MRAKALLFTVVLLGSQTACDKAVSVRYRVAMQAAEADSIGALSVAITDALTERHAIGPHQSNGCSLAAYFIDFWGAHWMDFCVTRRGNGVEFSLAEWVNRPWSPKGDSLRHELRDTLEIQFGPRFNELK
jgi:hypothetical protein